MAKTTYTDFDWSWYRRAHEAIAQGALTNSKRTECLVKGVYPTHISHGLGCYLRDTNGKHYVDFICGLGTNIIGYGDPQVAAAISTAAQFGVSPSLPSALEVEVAEKIKELLPFVDRVKFLKSGSEACTAAIRIARAATKRKTVLTEGYHGWHDEFVSLAPPALGVAGKHEIAKLDSLDAINDTVAAVIVEPIMTDTSRDRIKWLQELRERCTESGTVLIFDEVITGFRFPRYSVSNFYGISPDLICLGKAIANGMPLAVVAGKAALMDCGEYFVSSTYAGEMLSLAAAKKTMTLLQTKYDISLLWDKGSAFIKKINELLPGKLWIEGYPTRGVFRGDDVTKALFWQEACRAGILFGPSFFFNFAHVDVMDTVLNSCSDIAMRIKTGSVKLVGEMPSSPFAQRMRG